MIANASPIEFSQSEIIKVSYFLQVKMSDVLKVASRTYLVSENEASQLNQAGTSYSNGCYLVSDCVYTNLSMMTQQTKEKVLLTVFLFLNDDKESIRPMLQDYQKWLNSFTNYRMQIADKDRILDELSSVILKRVGWRKWDMNAFAKAARKYRATFGLDDEGQITLKFKNVKCGNDSEGYIQYKSIMLILKKASKHPRRVVYEFSNFFWDTNWQIGEVGTLHPHFDGGTLCFGNRSGDYDMYVGAHSYPFIVETLKDALSNYSPDNGPFSRVSDIRQRIDVLTNVIDVNLNKDEKHSLNEVNNPEQWLREIISASKCRHCGGILVNGICMGSNCVANPNAIINCRLCGERQVISSWSEAKKAFNRYCPNEHCEKSPNYVNVVETPFCRACGGPTDENYKCANTHCSGSLQQQWKRRGKNNYSAVNISYFSFVGVDQIEALKQAFSEKYFCPSCGMDLFHDKDEDRYYCINRNCRTQFGVVRNSLGWVEHLLPRCSSCNTRLASGPDGTLICNRDICVKYKTVLFDNHGRAVQPTTNNGEQV